MRPDVRERYDLETLWGDAARVKAVKPKKKAAAQAKKPAKAKKAKAA
jgi:hypothetical protein